MRCCSRLDSTRGQRRLCARSDFERAAKIAKGAKIAKSSGSPSESGYHTKEPNEILGVRVSNRELKFQRQERLGNVASVREKSRDGWRS